MVVRPVPCVVVIGRVKNRPEEGALKPTSERRMVMILKRPRIPAYRLGRSMRHLITLIEDLRGRGIGFRSLNEGAVDTTSASGELIFNIFSALAQFERRLIQERTTAGLAAARARGRNGGRPKITAGQAKVVLTKKLHADKGLDIDDNCSTLRISRSTFYRYVRLEPE